MLRGLCLIPLLGWLLIVAPVDVRADAMVTVLQEINALRREHGLLPVRIEPRLTVEARAHARDMARHDYFDTRTPDGKKFETRLVSAEYPFRRMFVQLAVGHPTSLGVVAGWMPGSWISVSVTPRSRAFPPAAQRAFSIISGSWRWPNLRSLSVAIGAPKFSNG